MPNLYVPGVVRKRLVNARLIMGKETILAHMVTIVAHLGGSCRGGGDYCKVIPKKVCQTDPLFQRCSRVTGS